METNKFRKVIAKLDDKVVKQPIFNLSSGYIQRSQEQMPKMGTVYPWVYYQNYLWDILQLRFRSIIDQYISFE